MLCCLALAGTPVSGCSDDEDTSGIDRRSPSDGGIGAARADGGVDGGLDATGSDAAALLTEAQVVGVAAAINTGEIEAGTLAQTKATDAATRDFASMMVTMHTAAQARQSALGITPASSSQQSTVMSMSASALQALQTVPAGPSFDAAYLQSQIAMHTSALEIIDEVLRPSATTAALRSELTRTRGEVISHLSQARTLAGSRDGGA